MKIFSKGFIVAAIIIALPVGLIFASSKLGDKKVIHEKII